MPTKKAPYVSSRCRFKRAAGEDPGAVAGDAISVSTGLTKTRDRYLKKLSPDFSSREMLAMASKAADFLSRMYLTVNLLS